MIFNGELLDMNGVYTRHKNLLGEKDSNSNHKKYLKNLLLENIPYLSFSRPLSKRESDILCSDQSKANAIDRFRSLPDEYNQIFKVASKDKK